MQPHRSNALRYASAARDAHSRVYGGCAAEAAVSEASGPRVSGCPRAPRYFSPHPVYALQKCRGSRFLPTCLWAIEGKVFDLETC